MHLPLNLIVRSTLASTAFTFLAGTAFQDQKQQLAVDSKAKHMFLFAGLSDIGSPQIALKQFSDGREVYGLSRPQTQPGTGKLQAFEDVTVNSQSIMITAITSSAVVTYAGRPDRTWTYEAPPHTEIHSIQMIAKDRVLVMQNGTPAKALIFDFPHNKLVKEVVIPTNVKAPHDMFRHVRMTRSGTLLVPHLAENKVCEYNLDGKLLWSVHAASPWHAERLANGNTLIAGDWHHYAREVDSKGRTVWEFSQKDLPGMPLGNVHTANRLSNGNTVLSFWFVNSPKEFEWPGYLQILELTPDKKVVWAVSSWQRTPSGEYLGAANTIQLMDQTVMDENVYVERPGTLSTDVIGRSKLSATKKAAVKLSKNGNIEMASIPAGLFSMGDDDIKDNRRHPVFLDAYEISKTPVTVSQFKTYCRATGNDFSKFTKPGWGWIDECPMVSVTWQQARDFCKWAGGDLPTEAQWEKAARGTEGNRYPWGNEWDDSRLQCSADGRFASAHMTSAVDAHQSGTSPFGCLDMAGNVWQWCLDWYEPITSTKEARNPAGPIAGKQRTVRGGSWKFLKPLDLFRCAYRHETDPANLYDDIGFRLAIKQ